MEESGGVMKRFFPFIFKPVLLILLFLIAVAWMYHVHVAVLGIERMASIDGLSPETRVRERDRLSSFGSFLMNVFAGNLGVSFMSLRPVSVELAARLPTTLLLIGLSIVFSLLIGVGFAALLAVITKRGRRRPSTFAHSLRGFFFGATPLVAFIFLLFSYYAYVAFGFQIFPVRGMYSIPPPTDPVAYIADVAWHLTLPVAVIVSVNVVRTLLIILSSGSPFTTKRLLKRLLLPITTIDFTFTISAVILVEYIFTLPGMGSWFLTSLLVMDIPVVMAAFVAFVAIAVGLGFVSVLLDFIQRLVGLRNDLDKKSEAQLKINEGQASFFKNYIKPFVRKKSLMIGLPIVIVFLAFALFAPWLTPYDPNAQPRLAESVAMPEWVTVFPQYRNLTKTQEETLSWNVESDPFDLVRGGWGTSVGIQYEAEDLQLVQVELSSKLSYMQNPPNEFFTQFRYEATNIQDVEYSLTLSLFTPEGDKYLFYRSPTLLADQGEDVTLDSKNPIFLATLGFTPIENVGNVVFAQKGDYDFNLLIQLMPLSESATAHVTIKDSRIVILGQVHGILGTDFLARDVFSQIVYGARTIVIFVFPFAFLAVMLGLPFGFLSGYFQGWTDNVIAPIVDTLLCLPFLPILLVNVYLLGAAALRETFILTFSLLFLFAPATMAFRNIFLVRPSNQKLTGNTPAKRVFNVFKDLFSNLCLTSISLMLLLLGIELLGFGDPRVPSWGMMLQRAFGFGGFVHLAWWWIGAPIICIVLLTLGLLLVGAGLEDVSF